MVTLARRFCLVLPTALTLSALGCGLSSILASIDGNFWHAYWFLFASAMLDGLDGHVARALKATSAIGAELDSLCDLVDFGVSPAFVLLMWCRRTGGAPSAWYESDQAIWASFLVYVSACAYRLARFNLDDKVPVPHPPHSVAFKALDGSSSDAGNHAVLPSQTWLDQYVNRSKFFQGIPAPAAALVSLFPVVYWLQYEPSAAVPIPFRVRTVVPAVYLVVAVLMVARLRTFSSKMLIKGPVVPADPSTSHLRSRNPVNMILKAIGTSTFLYVYVTNPFMVHLIGTSLYLVTLPFAQFVYSFLLTEPKKHL